MLNLLIGLIIIVMLLPLLIACDDPTSTGDGKHKDLFEMEEESEFYLDSITLTPGVITLVALASLSVIVMLVALRYTNPRRRRNLRHIRAPIAKCGLSLRRPTDSSNPP